MTDREGGALIPASPTWKSRSSAAKPRQHGETGEWNGKPSSNISAVSGAPPPRASRCSIPSDGEAMARIRAGNRRGRRCRSPRGSGRSRRRVGPSRCDRPAGASSVRFGGPHPSRCRGHRAHRERGCGQTLDARSPQRRRQSAHRYFEVLRNGCRDKVHGETIPFQPGFTVLTVWEPHGVTGHIVPWNYPLQMTRALRRASSRDGQRDRPEARPRTRLSRRSRWHDWRRRRASRPAPSML